MLRRAFVTALVVFVLWLVKGFIHVAAEMNPFIAVFAGLVGFLGFLFSYLRHRSKGDELALDALRVANAPGSTNKDWENLLDQSDQGWDKTPVLMDIFAGLLIWTITFSVSFLVDDPEMIAWIKIGVLVLGIYVWSQFKQAREREQFEKTLAAANAGRWFPGAEDSEADKSPRGKVKEFARELPEKLLDSALRGFEDELK